MKKHFLLPLLILIAGTVLYSSCVKEKDYRDFTINAVGRYYGELITDSVVGQWGHSSSWGSIEVTKIDNRHIHIQPDSNLPWTIAFTAEIKSLTNGVGTLHIAGFTSTLGIPRNWFGNNGAHGSFSTTGGQSVFSYSIWSTNKDVNQFSGVKY